MIHKIFNHKVRVSTIRVEPAQLVFFSKIRVEPAQPNFGRLGPNCAKIPFCGVFIFWVEPAQPAFLTGWTGWTGSSQENVGKSGF